MLNRKKFRQLATFFKIQQIKNRKTHFRFCGLHALCNMSCTYAPFTMHNATCAICHAPFTMYHVPCVVCRTSCAIYHVPCAVCHIPRVVRRVPCTMCRALNTYSVRSLSSSASSSVSSLGRIPIFVISYGVI